MPQPEADVLVIGAGVIGCAVAFELADAGARVRVIDARTPGAGASQASAGVLAPYVEGHASRSLRTLGRRSLDMYAHFVRRVVERSGLLVEFERRGTVEVAVSETDEVRLRAWRGTLTAEGIDAEWCEPSALADLEPALAPGIRGGLVIPLHATVDVPAFVRALAEAAVRSGAVFSSGVAASRVSNDDQGLAVHTPGGVLRAPHVVLAAGTWAAGLAPPGSSPLPVRPIRGQLLCLAAAPRTVRHVVWGPDVYLVPRLDGTVLVGATSEDVGFDERATAAGVAQLLGAATALVPELADATFLEVRKGLRPASPDDLPYVGESAVAPGLIYACGHYRNGALLAPLTAELVASLVAGRASNDALTAFSPGRAGRL